jgi:hypothetical protein
MAACCLTPRGKVERRQDYDRRKKRIMGSEKRGIIG